MNLKISATFEGKCDFCKKKSTVFTLGDEDTNKVVTICKKCSAEKGSKSVTELVEESGKVDKKVFEPGIKVEKKGIAQ